MRSGVVHAELPISSNLRSRILRSPSGVLNGFRSPVAVSLYPAAMLTYGEIKSGNITKAYAASERSLIILFGASKPTCSGTSSSRKP